MKNTMIICSHNRPMQDQTTAAIRALVNLGARYLPQRGTADVALARNCALSFGMRAIANIDSATKEDEGRLWHPPASHETWVVLMVDDDMVFTPEQAQHLVDQARDTGDPVSAMYATLNQTLAASRIKVPDGAEPLWVAGLGLLAIPHARLLDLQGRSRTFSLREKDQPITEYTWSACDGSNWYSEDYTLCRRFGGVRLAPVPVGHLKVIPLYPDEYTVAAVRDQRWLDIAETLDDARDANPITFKHPSERGGAEPKVERVSGVQP